MQFQSDISDVVVKVPDSEELSGIGPAYAVGIALNIWDKSIFHQITRKKYLPQMKKETRNKKYTGWKNSVRCVLGVSFALCFYGAFSSNGV